VLNTSKDTQELLTGTCLGKLCPVEVVSTFEETATATDDIGPFAQAIKVAAPAVDATAIATAATPASEVVAPLMDRLPDGMTDSQPQQVANLLNEYSDVFSKDPYDMGRTHLVEHTIDTQNHRPIRQGLRRQPLALLDETDRQVDELLKHGLQCTLGQKERWLIQVVCGLQGFECGNIQGYIPPPTY